MVSSVQAPSNQMPVQSLLCQMRRLMGLGMPTGVCVDLIALNSTQVAAAMRSLQKADDTRPVIASKFEGQMHPTRNGQRNGKAGFVCFCMHP